MTKPATTEARRELDYAKAVLAQLVQELGGMELPGEAQRRITQLGDNLSDSLARLTLIEAERSLWRSEWKRRKDKAPPCGALRVDGKPCEARALPGRTGCKWHGQEIKP